MFHGTNKEQRMKFKGARFHLRIAAGLAGVALALVAPVVAAGPTSWLVTFSIDSGPSYALAGDGLDPIPPDLYKDFRLGTGLPDDVNYCVEASPTTTLFLRLNRKLDGAAGDLYCGEHGGTQRQFYATISSAAACAELAAYGYPAGPEAPCTFSGADKPRIDIGADLWGRRTTTAPVAFLSKWYDVYRVSYELRLESKAVVLSPGVDPSMRILSYSGAARLWRFEPGEKPKAVADSFGLPFQITLKRTEQ
jgi:hypothetical protein